MPKELQVCDSKTPVVWLMYSRDRMDRNEFCKDNKNLAEEKYNQEINIAMKHTSVKDGKA